ncbi:MAG: DUF3626 domain-containing protein [Clostridia bacterium]|nr:DUF3626 domain-containing protein [Clostridia bacterium]
MTKNELAEKIATFPFEDMEHAHDVLMKAATVFGYNLGNARAKADEALGRAPGAWKENRKGIRFEPEWLKTLDHETLYGLALYLYDFDDVLQPWKHYEKAFRDVMEQYISSRKHQDRMDGFYKRRSARRDNNPVMRWRKRKQDRLDAKWITIGATPEDKEAGLPAGKGRHVLIDDEGKIVSGAGGSLTGVTLSEAKSTSEEVKVDPAKVSTAAEGAGKAAEEVSKGEGKSSEAEPKGLSEATESSSEASEGEVEKKEEKPKLRVISSGAEFAEALGKAASKEERQAILDKMPASSILKLDGESYRKKTNGEWVLAGHKAPKDIAGFEDKDWSSSNVRTSVDVFKEAAKNDFPEFIEDILHGYAVGTIIKLRKDGDMALERKKSGWIVTSGGEYYGISIPTGASSLKDLTTWQNLADTMDNWYVKRKKDGDVATKEPSKDLLSEFDEEAGKDDKDFEDLLKECEVGTTIDVDGDTFKCVGKDAWEHDIEGKEYEIGDVLWLSNKVNNAKSFYVGSHRVAKPVDMTAARKAAKADWEKYTTPEYLASVPSLKNYDKKVQHYRDTSFKVFTDEEIEEANGLIAKIFDNAEYCARFPGDIIDSIIEKGLLNQFETGTSHGFGDFDHGGRYQASGKLFGTTLKKDGEWADGKTFEKYGLMSERDTLLAGDAGGDQYGNCVLIFEKEAVKDRATFTCGDSLGLAFEPGKAGHPPTVFGLLRRGTTYSDWEKDEFMEKLRKAKTVQDLKKFSGYPHYVEMQYHGKMPISTVKEIVVGSDTVISAASKAKLEEYGITVTVKNIGGSKHAGHSW